MTTQHILTSEEIRVINNLLDNARHLMNGITSVNKEDGAYLNNAIKKIVKAQTFIEE